MDFFGGLSETSETSEMKGMEGNEISKESKEKFDKLMGDDKFDEAARPEDAAKPKQNQVEIDNKFNKLFDSSDLTRERVGHDDRNIEDNGEAAKNCPIENGTWEGERGDSKWLPDPEYIPQKKNPEQKKWEEILDDFDIDGIDFEDGEPDFSEVSKGDVEIEPFSTNRDDNFDKADIELAKQKGCTPEEVAKWRKEHDYTWHECNDMKTMQKVPSIVHNNVSHRGGISEAKGGN